MERKSGVIDLPANVTFQRNDDDWELDQSVDVIMSVQAFLNGAQLIVELWGTTTVVTPTGKRYEGYEFQQNSWIERDSRAWRAKRIVYNVHDQSHLVERGVIFEIAGTARDVAKRRRI
jgi:hypothetical protein